MKEPMQARHSEAYYLAQLLERLQSLESELTKRIGPQAELTARCSRLLRELYQLLPQEDTRVSDLLEYSLLPQINRLLLEAREELKLKQPLTQLGKKLVKKFTQPALASTQLRAAPAPSPAPPKPLSEDERKSLIEDALSKLKMLLSAS